MQILGIVLEDNEIIIKDVSITNRDHFELVVHVLTQPFPDFIVEFGHEKVAATYQLGVQQPRFARGHPCRVGRETDLVGDVDQRKSFRRFG